MTAECPFVSPFNVVELDILCAASTLAPVPIGSLLDAFTVLASEPELAAAVPKGHLDFATFVLSLLRPS